MQANWSLSHRRFVSLGQSADDVGDPAQLAVSRQLIDRIAIMAVGAAVGVAQAAGRLPFPIDAGAYWSASLDHLYGARWDATGYVYPPPMAQLLAPFHMLPWAVFIVLWTTLIWAALAWMLGRWTWAIIAAGIVAVVIPPLHVFSAVLAYTLNGNVQILLAAAVVLAMRRPAWWAVGALTKFGTGIGVLWPLFRRDYRAVAEAVGATAAIVAVSFVLAPALWFDWARYMIASVGGGSPMPIVPISLPFRLLMSSALTWYAARTDRAWLVAIAAGWAIPALYGWSFVGVWIAAVPLHLAQEVRPSEVPAGRQPVVESESGLFALGGH